MDTASSCFTEECDLNQEFCPALYLSSTFDGSQVLSLLLCGWQEAAAINFKPFFLELFFKFVYSFCAVNMLNSTYLHMLLF